MNDAGNNNLETLPYLSRDVSWVDFNERVMREGLRAEKPLLERLRFLSIVSANFDEFFMVRFAALKRLRKTDAAKAIDPSGLIPEEQLAVISEKAHSIIERQYNCLQNEIFPGLAKNGLSLLRPDAWSVPQLDFLDSFFVNQIYPVLTPLRLEEGKPMPFIESRLLNAIFLLEAENASDRAASEGYNSFGGGEMPEELKVIVPIPSVLDRIVWLPGFESVKDLNGKEMLQFALLEDIIVTWGTYLFPGYRIRESMMFKINRDADFSVDEQRDEDYVEAMVQVLEDRGRAEVIRMVYSPGSSKLRDELSGRFAVENDCLYEVDGPINPADFLELINIASLEDLIEKPWKTHKSLEFSGEPNTGSPPIWERISQGDVMLHLPYQSFDPVIRFFQEAASDPQVISIKTALYRTGGAIPGIGINSGSSSYSPVVRALEQAALNGKHVTAVVELKARFDEERNISWANRLEKAGVIVVYGLSNLKIHSKVSMVLRRENDRVRRYVHLSTGNYNDRTARYYEDICLFTCRDDIAYDAGLIFNMLTGYSAIQSMNRLTIAPTGLKRRFIELIEREAGRAKHDYPARITAKMNSLTDIDIVRALYAASQAGVKISLCIRGICTLIPGVEGISENIRVISVIDHYLEHSRIYYFSNGGAEEIYLASADWMTRNLEHRVEILFPVQDEKLSAELIEILNDYFRDNCQASALDNKGMWKQLTPPEGEEKFRVQKQMLSRAARDADIPGPAKMEYTVRRSLPVVNV